MYSRAPAGTPGPHGQHPIHPRAPRQEGLLERTQVPQQVTCGGNGAEDGNSGLYPSWNP